MWLVPCVVLRLYKKSKRFFKNSFVTGHQHDKALQRYPGAICHSIGIHNSGIHNSAISMLQDFTLLNIYLSIRYARKHSHGRRFFEVIINVKHMFDDLQIRQRLFILKRCLRVLVIQSIKHCFILHTHISACTCFIIFYLYVMRTKPCHNVIHTLH